MATNWKEMGEDNFAIDVLDELKPVDEPDHDYTDDLRELEAMWMEKLKPYDERGYTHIPDGARP